MNHDEFISRVRTEIAKSYDLKTDAEIDAFFLGIEEGVKDKQESLEKRDKMLRDTVAELCEAKRLLKSAIDEWHIVCEWGNCGEYCGWFENGKCSQEWSGEAEALKLIGEDEDENS